jgi:prepilin-type N-terminal cleavage/methylation domain-containing protein
MADSRRQSGFSLIEVAVALGVVAIGIVVILSLLPVLLRQRADSEATHTALGLASAITGKLTEVAAGNLGNISGHLASPSGNTADKLCLVASREGSSLRVRANGSLADGDEYFLVELFQLPAPLAYDADTRMIAINVQVSWPYRIKTGDQTIEAAADNRQSVTFIVSLRQ